MQNIGIGKIAVGISLKVFEELLQELQKEELGDLNFQQDVYPIEGNQAIVLNANVDLNLHPIQFRIEYVSSIDWFTCLSLSGNVKVSVSSPDVEGPTLYDLPFSVKLKIGLELEQKQNRAPVIKLNNEGIHDISGPIPESMVTDMVNSSSIAQFINDFELDILHPAVDGIEEILFLNETKPNKANWLYNIQLLRGNSFNTVDAYAIVIDVPNGNVNFPNTESFVPDRSELIIQFTDSMVQAMVQEANEELTSWFENIKGVDIRVDRLNLTVDGNQLYLDAKIKDHKYDAEVEIKGPVYFRHAPGSTNIGLDMKDVDIDVDLPWWADVLVWLADIWTFGLLGINNSIHNKIPNFAQVKAQETLDRMLPQITSSLDFSSLSFQDVDVEVYTDLITLNDGAITVYNQILIDILTESLDRADYSTLRNRFIFFHLRSGRRFQVQDLAEFMRRNLVQIPGYHEVDGKYIRSNPDNTEGNNLLKRYGR